MATVDPTQSTAQAPEDYSAEVARARALAERYREEYVEMSDFRIDQELFRAIPADLMLRYGFVPYKREGQLLVIVVSDPTGQGHGRCAIGDPVDSEEEREFAACAGGRDRGL
jgi:hypothetical protein